LVQWPDLGGLKAPVLSATTVAIVHRNHQHHHKLRRLQVSIDTSRGHPEMDYAQHNQTYTGFINFTKYSIVALVALLAGMYLFLV
jgi:hypothetical protein